MTFRSKTRKPRKVSTGPIESIRSLELLAGVADLASKLAVCDRLGIVGPLDDVPGYMAELERLIAQHAEAEA